MHTPKCGIWRQGPTGVTPTRHRNATKKTSNGAAPGYLSPYTLLKRLTSQKPPSSVLQRTLPSQKRHCLPFRAPRRCSPGSGRENTGIRWSQSQSNGFCRPKIGRQISPRKINQMQPNFVYCPFSPLCSRKDNSNNLNCAFKKVEKQVEPL